MNELNETQYKEIEASYQQESFSEHVINEIIGYPEERLDFQEKIDLELDW